jgi:ubiquinone/menaquinone biosynthesis C-methylase UbiE
MSTPDEMGLTPEAALGYEQFFVPAIFHQWPAKMLAAAEIGRGEDVLDAGCGTGVLTRELASTLQGTGSVAGFDLSESMLGVARGHCPGVSFRQGNITALPYADASFDVVVSSFMLMFVAEPATAISEMRRVLRPGGRLVISVWQGLDNNAVYAALVEATRETVDAASASSLARPFSMGEKGKLISIMNSAGFTEITAMEHAGTADFPSVEDFVQTEIQAWLLADSVNATQISRLVDHLRSRCAGFAGSTGAITFSLNALLARGVAN